MLCRYFGLLSLRSPYTGYEDTVGLRNSHDKSIVADYWPGVDMSYVTKQEFEDYKTALQKELDDIKAQLPTQEQKDRLAALSWRSNSALMSSTPQA